MTTTILVPVLRRPRRLAPLLDNIEATTMPSHEVVFIADENDWDERLELDRLGARYITVDAEPPNYPAKMNGAFARTTGDFVFLAADDVIFHHRWLDAALDAMTEHVAVVGTNDGGVNGRVARGAHSTHTLVRRDYVITAGATFDETPGVLLHDGYRHSYVDDELITTAQRRRVYAHAHDALVEHRHPFGGTAETDEVYELGHRFAREDRDHHQRRRHQYLGRLQRWTSPSWSQPSATPAG